MLVFERMQIKSQDALAFISFSRYKLNVMTQLSGIRETNGELLLVLGFGFPYMEGKEINMFVRCNIC